MAIPESKNKILTRLDENFNMIAAQLTVTLTRESVKYTYFMGFSSYFRPPYALLFPSDS